MKSKNFYQRGASTLIVVVVVTIVLAVVVLFGYRTIVFEQKTANNHYRYTLAFEAADAGIDWATAMLNKKEKINTSCLTDNSAEKRFKDKYMLTVEEIEKKNHDDNKNYPLEILVPRRNLADKHDKEIVAICVYNLNFESEGEKFDCSCPTLPDTDPEPDPDPTIFPVTNPENYAAIDFSSAPAIAGAKGYTPGFAIAFRKNSVTGTVDLVSYGCSSRTTTITCPGDAGVEINVSLAQVSGLSSPPAAPLTARGNISVGNAAFYAINSDPNTNGVTINAGGTIDAIKAILTTVPGTPPWTSVVGNDPSLSSLTEDDMFTSYFGMSKDAYKNLPSTKILSCTSCDEDDIKNAYNAGFRQLWIDGDLDMNATATIGTEKDPMVLVADGSISISGNLEIYAVMYSTAVNWDNTGGGNALLRGAAISEGNFTGNGTPKYYYDPDVMFRIKTNNFSFVKVPGSWRDFQ